MQDQKVHNDKVTQMLNEWYQEMKSHQFLKAAQSKKVIDEQINELHEEDQTLLLYYSLLSFRYKVLTENLSIGVDSFDRIEEMGSPSDSLLTYYYHFFKAVHATVLTNYSEAGEYYAKAEQMLENIPDELEQAEFFYRFSTFNYQKQEPLKAIKYSDMAKVIFTKHKGYEINIAFCENVYGLACVDLRQFEQAEENFSSAMGIFMRFGEENLALRVRSNLGWLYASQNLSLVALRHITEVTKNIPNHFKAVFTEAEENYKLGNNEQAEKAIESGLNICHGVGNTEFLHRFRILHALNRNIPAAEIEPVVKEGFSYFEKENLFECMQDYAEKLAIKYYEENDTVKASEYFLLNSNLKKQQFERGALK
jgi:response regulator aspartate phosphatase F